MNWLRIHVSNLCNFKCPNCHVFELGENNLPNRVMSQDVFNQAIDQFLNVMSLKGHKETMISIYGGETMANKKVIKEGIERYGTNCNGIELSWVVNTNGSLIKEEDILFFKEHNVELHISVDGSEDIHNLSRPTHKGKGTFHMVVPALELIKKHEAPAQVNSYMMPSNYLHLHEIVDIAHQYGIKKIYLDQFYNLDMISHQVGMARYKEVYYYALQKGIQISGPWGRIIRKFQRFTKRRDQIENNLAVDVNIDGSFYVSIMSETKKEHREVKDLTSFFQNGGWDQIIEKARLFYDEKCEGCSIKDYCYGSAIEQVHYHIGVDADTEVSCNFFRDWCNYLLRPMYMKRYSKLTVVSMIDIAQIEGMVSQVEGAIQSLEERLWPLSSKIQLNIFDDHDEFKNSCQANDLPSWVKAVTKNDNTLYHLGPNPTPALVHELTHLFLSQKRLRLPSWFIEGVCEWTQKGSSDPAILLQALPDRNLAGLISEHGDGLNLIAHDGRKPYENSLYIQAHAFVCHLERRWGREKFLSFLEVTGECPFEEAFLRFEKESPKRVLEDLLRA